MIQMRQFAAGVAVCLAVTLSGCADRPMPVPASATLVSQGNGEVVSYRAPESGRVYVTDQSDSSIIYQGEVQRGENIELNARDDRLSVGGRTVYNKPLDDGHQFRIYFEQTGPVVQERLVRERVIVEPQR